MSHRLLMRFARFSRESAVQCTDAWKGHPQGSGALAAVEEARHYLSPTLSASDERQITRIPELNVFLASPCGVHTC